MTVAFYIAAAVAVIATSLVISRTNAAHALLYLIVSLLAVATVFFTLGAPFVAALEVIVYAGAIMVLFLFVVMMLNPSSGGADPAERRERIWLSGGVWVGPGVLALVLLAEMVWILAGSGAPVGEVMVEPRRVGAALFGPYVLAVELAGFLLLAGLVGAYHLGRKDRPSPRHHDAHREGEKS